MSVNINSETLAILEKQAKFFGLSADEYLRGLLPKISKELTPGKDANDEFETDMIAFAEKPETASNYDGSYSREDVYFDHD